MRNTKKFKMDFVQKVTLSPIEKYVMYNRFPWKMVVHFLLLIFTTYQALSIVNQRTAHTRAEHIVLKYILLEGTDDSDRTVYFNLQDFSDQLTMMVDNLNSIDELLIQTVDTSHADYKMYIYYRQLDMNNIDQAEYSLDLSEGLVQPFNASDIQSIKGFLSEVAMFEIQGVGLVNLINFPDQVGSLACSNWTFNLRYNFQSFANIEVTIDTGDSNCSPEFYGTDYQQMGQDFLMVHVIVIIIAAVGLALSWKHIYHTGAEYMHQREVFRQVKEYVSHNQLESNQQTPMQQAAIAAASPDLSAQQMGLNFQQSWNQLGMIEQMPLLDMWFIVSVLGNFIQIVGSIIAVIDSVTSSNLSVFKFQEALIGFGCMAAWLMMLKYLEYNPNINLMTSTLRFASTNIFMFMLGVLPFFFGFVFLGQCLFWRFDRFSNTLNSILSLFALSNGDIVSDTFGDTWSVGILGQMFLVIFMILFFTAVQNVFITIIMEGFEQNRKNKQLQQQQQRQNAYQQVGTKQDLDDQNEDFSRSPNTRLLMEVGGQHDDKEMVIGKLKLNTRRVERLLDEMEQLLQEIENSRIRPEEKAYLLSVYRENVENVNRNLKFQLSNIAS